jgi:hypothetical protein
MNPYPRISAAFLQETLRLSTKFGASAPDRISKIANRLPLVTETKDISTMTWL